MGKAANDIHGRISDYCARNRLPYNKLVSAIFNWWPDCIVIKKGITYWFEIKSENDDVSSGQELTREEFNETGSKEIAFVVGSFKEFKEIIENV